MADLFIKGGRLIDPASGTDRTADVHVSGSRIARISGESGGRLDVPAGAEVIDAEGLIITPGLIDPHVHLREPGGEHKETIASGTAAAVAGGFTTVCSMPNTTPATDSPEMLRAVRARADETAHCRVFPVCAATLGRKGEHPVEFRLCKQAGAVGFSDDGDVVASAGMMARVLALTADADSVFMQHAQEPTLTQGAVMHAGSVSARLGVAGWPRVAEELIVERDVRLVGAAPGSPRYHVQHLSSGGSIEILKRAQQAGLRVTAEVSPHHLTLTHESIAGKDGRAFHTGSKMNPPLREQADIDALRRAVADGIITVLATDHAPHTADEKSLPLEDAPFGIVGLETALALYIEALVTTGAIDWPRLIAMMTIEPARLCGLDGCGLGSLAEGGPADITLIDPDDAWTIDRDTFKGKSSNSPFLHRRVRGRAVATVVAGRVAAKLDPATASMTILDRHAPATA